MNTLTIVQKLWNYCYGPGRGQSRARSPAREYAGTREKPRFTLRDDLSACDAQAGAQASNQKGLLGLIFTKSQPCRC